VTWNASLDLHYARADSYTIVKYEHSGPLRILRSLYPEGPQSCHNILIHPPSGLVGGDRLDIHIDMVNASHALITTPGATRFYKSESKWATQDVQVVLQDSSRLEWLPLETLAYDGCMARNICSFDLKDQSELIAWDVTALGMPSAKLPFINGLIEQHFEIKGHWLDKGSIKANDMKLLNSPLGLNARKCLATLVFASAKALGDEQRNKILELAREVIQVEGPNIQVGATSPGPNVIVVRALSDLVEPSMKLLRSIWLEWRSQLWGLSPVMPRIWAL